MGEGVINNEVIFLVYIVGFPYNYSHRANTNDLTPVNYYKQEVEGTKRLQLQMLPPEDQRRQALSILQAHGFLQDSKVKHLGLGQESLPSLKFSKYFQPPLHPCNSGRGLSWHFLLSSGLQPPSPYLKLFIPHLTLPAPTTH